MDIPKHICLICEKAYSQRKQLTRHSNYCRKKAARPTRSRKRSCEACVTAKSHCDALLPACSRCLAKGHGCVYPSRDILAAASAGTEITSSATSNDIFLASEYERLSGTSKHSKQWSFEPDFEASAPMTELALVSRPIDTPWWSAKWGESDLVDISRGSYLSSSSSTAALWRQPKLPITRAFQLVTTQDRASSLSLRHILAQLRSFPAMIMPGSSGPPFIHWRQMQKEPALPLARCGGIMALWSTMNSTTMPFVCTCIRFDVERLTAEGAMYDDQDAVAALQATCAYGITRASARDDEWFDFDIPLIRNMNRLSVRVRGITMRHCPPGSAVCPGWESWILVESLRRTLLTIFVMLFTHDLTAAPEVSACDLPRFWAEMLIPSTRQLWEAKTREQFEQAWELSDHDRRLTIEQLCNHNRLGARDSRFLDAWLGQIDEFGHLIAMVANWVEVVDTAA